MPYVTGHKYYIRWEEGFDFNEVKVQIIGDMWDDDESIEFVMPHVERREAIHFESNMGRQANLTYAQTDAQSRVMGMNDVFNDTETKEATFVVNARDGSDTLTIKGIKCLGDCVPPPPPVPDKPLEEATLWSDPNTWKELDNRVPLPGEDVKIPPDHNVIFDIGDSPLFNSVEVNGKLSFLEGKDAKLNTYALWVRAGEIVAGSEDKPFENKIEFMLYGNRTTESNFTFSQDVDSSNKHFIVTSKVELHGKKRSESSRMRSSANPGDLKFRVAPDLDWKAGDLLGLAPTNMDARMYEYVTIKSYNSGSGEVEAEEKLKSYHYGAPDSTGDKYRGVDMRGEVLLLSRNIMITSNKETNSTHLTHPDPWPCRVIVADFFEPSDLTLRTGEIMWDGVGIHDCSQTETEHAALKFINAAKGDKVLKNSVLARGNGIGIDINTSKKVKLQNNAIFDMVEYGVRA